MFTNVFQDKIKFNADDIFTLSGEIFWEIFFKSSFYVLCYSRPECVSILQKKFSTNYIPRG